MNQAKFPINKKLLEARRRGNKEFGILLVAWFYTEDNNRTTT
jgi:hypothetical protein